MFESPVLGTGYEGKIPEVVILAITVDVNDELVTLQASPHQSANPISEFGGIHLLLNAAAEGSRMFLQIASGR